jgi:hypothetical protein
MNLRIHNATTKPEWLARVDCLLHDATPLERFTYDATTKTFSLTLMRIGYEHGTRRFGFILRYPAVPCALSLSPVELASVEEGPEAWVGLDQVVGLELPEASVLILHTRESTIRLVAMAPVLLGLIDTGAPDKSATMIDLFRSVIPMSIVEDAANTTDA